VAGSDGNLWFTESTANDIGRVTTAGVFKDFPILLTVALLGIASGPDGNVWFAENSGTSIGQILTGATAAGTIAEFPVALGSSVIATGPDGNLWFTPSTTYYYYYSETGNFGRITTAGVATLFNLPFEAMGITAGPDGNLWVTELSGIARFAP
jgi:virginiamycin B lyase